jgi:diguanylate cyclase (GGDEF)-like protein
VAGTDVVGRFGGDEFVVLLAGIGEDARAFAIANRLIAELSDPIIVDNQQHRIGVSIGIVMRRASDTSAQELVRAADAAMYRAKETGRNRAILARPKG